MIATVTKEQIFSVSSQCNKCKQISSRKAWKEETIWKIKK